ncbi:hypothetical protein [Streptomyces sp. NPDC059122]|uniref:hypothetical protein n=1 Tax=Streptomyces sp. NPDC059122 TaxID=3346732 RepID=UPI0036B0C1E6
MLRGLALPPALPVWAVEVGDLRYLALGGALADLVENEQDWRVHPLVFVAPGCGPAGAPHRLVDAVGVLLLLLEEPGILVELRGDEGGALGAVVGLDEQQRQPGLRGVRTTSARALPIAGFFQVPFTGNATSVA